MSGMNVARILLALVLLALAWVLSAAIDAWVPAAAAITVPTALAERLLYVAWKERRIVEVRAAVVEKPDWAPPAPLAPTFECPNCGTKIFATGEPEKEEAEK